MTITACISPEHVSQEAAFEHLPYEQDITGCLAKNIGPAGIGSAEFDSARRRAMRQMERLAEECAAGGIPALTITQREDDLDQYRLAARQLAAGANDVVLFGIGGSALAPRALRQLAKFLCRGKLNCPRLHVMDNPETPWMERFISGLDIDGLRFLVISKSGSTAETLMQCLWAIDYLQVHGFGSSISRRMLIVTEPSAPEDNPLRRIAAAHGIPVLDHPADIGGRYSAFSVVGMLPAFLLGLNAKALRRGGARVLGQAIEKVNDPEASPPLMGAALHAGLLKGIHLRAVVMMPYTSQLDLFTAWWRQLWAESLGKDGNGPIPVGATGPLDQHSQLQLFLDGPNDKLFTIIMPQTAGQGYRAPASLAQDADERLSCLGGHTIGDLTDCEQRATVESLMRKGRPVRTFRIPTLSEEVLGALFMHFMIETILTGYLLGVDPFNQPAVEFSKRITRELLRKVPVPGL